MNNVLLIIDTTEEELGKSYFFGTVAEAQTFAGKEAYRCTSFDIYTLYTQGTIGAIQWKFQTDTATNLREVKKTTKKKKAKRTSYTWSELEIATLLKNYKEGMSIGEIAKKLSRTYNAVYSKLVQQKAITPIKRT